MEISAISEFVTNFISSIVDILQKVGPFAGIFIVVLESMIPILPLGVFVSFNFSAYGVFLGFVLSYLATILGCVMAYFLSSKMLTVYVMNKAREYNKLNKVIMRIRNIKFASFVLIVALPFSPAFLINLSCGIVGMDIKKFLSALFIGKISIIYFWGMVGKSLIDSVADVKTIVIILMSLSVSYLLSKIVARKMNLE